MENTTIRITSGVFVVVGLVITFFAWQHFQQTHLPPARGYDFGPFAIVFGLAFLVFPDRFDDRKFGWLVFIVAGLTTLGFDTLLRSS